jgi:hypothetical protein
MKCRKVVMAFIAMGVLLASVASAQVDPRWLGSSRSGFTAGLAKPQAAAPISATATFSNASYGTGGVALRNRSKGFIHISGVTGLTQAAYLYWAVLLKDPTATQLAHASEVLIQREFPTSSTTLKVKGTLIAVGGDPCWGSSGTWVYRGVVPNTIATGNGGYKIVEAAPGLNDGEDPWDGNVVFPAWEGASLVIIGTGSANVGLYDGQAGTTFFGSTFSPSFHLPATVASGSQVLFDNFGYDGQFGSSRTIVPSLSNETTVAEGLPSTTSVLVAGPGGETGDSDWDGGAGWPLPQLWDDTGHDISNAFGVGDTDATVSFTSGNDCIGTVGAVISVQ